MTPEQHLQHLGEFCQAVRMAGGTTPHMLMAVEAASRCVGEEAALWRLGCYAFCYNFATAEALWLAWGPHDLPDEGRLATWCAEHWPGIGWRKERRAARSPAKLAECMASYRRYMLDALPARPWLSGPVPGAYEAAYGDLTANVRYMGRYIAIRWVEALGRLYGAPWLSMPDVRAEGGQHPRKALALMFPEQGEALLGGDGAEEVAVVDAVAERCRSVLARAWGVDTDYYTLQSLLCEYKQSALGGRQYPGRSIDSELAYRARIEGHWGPEYAERSVFHEVRRRLFPEACLGEVQGWSGPREELGGVLREHGYTWSDLLYDYRRTQDFARPAWRRA